jgi:CubicO group peptidase (beta-lactamase class C family)
LQLEDVIRKEYANIAGIVALKNGEIAYESYFGEFTAEDSLHVFSVTKSISSALVGIAVGRGLIESAEQRVLEFFPDYEVKRGEKTIQNVTIRNMLTMTAPYKYKSAPFTRFFTSEDWVKASLDLLGGKTAIGEFRYTPVIGPDILSGILVKATGKTVLEFAREALFSPLGINVPHNIVFKDKDEQMAFYKARSVRGWVADPNGVNTAAWGLCLRPADMAKLGQLYLNGGVWENRQLVSSEWIAESLKEYSRWELIDTAYGYMWWLIDEDSYAAMGDGGNAIYVNTKKNLVIAIASTFKPTAKDRIELIKNHIEPML